MGARLDRVGTLAGVGRGAAIVAGMLMVVWALDAIAAALACASRRAGAPEWIAAHDRRALLAAMRDQPARDPRRGTGLLTTLLPCGWLYTFVATAGGTGDPIGGAAVMIVFWVGTLPMMRRRRTRRATRSFGPFARRLPLVGAVAVLVLGAAVDRRKAARADSLARTTPHATHTAHAGR